MLYGANATVESHLGTVLEHIVIIFLRHHGPVRSLADWRHWRDRCAPREL